MPSLSFRALWVGLALGFAVILFLMGGGSRDDIASLPLLRPLAVALLTAAIIAAPPGAWLPYRWPLIALGVAALLVALQLVPLPPALWQALPGREIIVGIDRLAGLDGAWRPLNMAPSRGWNALFALAVPAAMLAVMVKAGEDAWAKLPVVLVLIGLGSAVLGALQLLSPGDGPLYLYRITNNDAAVGLFANRNHNAMFIACQFPLLAYVWLNENRSRGRRMWVLGALPVLALVHIAVLLTIGSRGGLVTGALGMLFALIMLARSRAFDALKDKVSRRAMAITAGASAAGVALLALVGIMRGQLVSVERLLNADVADDMRIRALGTILDMAWRYFPFGTGAGSFAEVYKIYEPDALLYESYLNRAHNDIVETVLTMGLPGAIGILLLAVVIVRGWWLVLRAGRGQGNAARSSKPWQAEALLGLAIITILATGSVLDYPLRVPSLAGLFVLAGAWFARGFAAQAGTAAGGAGQNIPR